MDYNLTFVSSCLTKKLLDHVKNADYSNQSYLSYGPKVGSNIGLYGVIIKITLCLITIFISLFGNLLVLYTMFLLPRIRQPYTTWCQKNGVSMQNIKNLQNKNPSKMNKITTSINKRFQKSYNQNQNATRTTFLQVSSSRAKTDDQRQFSCAYGNQTQNPVYIPVRIPQHRKTVNLFILNLIICDLMIVFWCSWVILLCCFNIN